MKTREFSLTTRIPYETIEKLKNISNLNNTTVSEITRDILFKYLSSNINNEHEFSNRLSWGIAVKNRDNYICKKCNHYSKKNKAHHKIPVYQGGKNILSNGITLCDKCHIYEHTTKLNDSIESSEYLWNKEYLYWQSTKTNKFELDFYKERIGCFYTKRKRGTSSFVQKYINSNLNHKNLDELKNILFSICPNPQTIKDFKSL